MTETSEPKWRTALFVAGSITTILVAMTTFMTNAFGLWEKSRKPSAEPTAATTGQPTAGPTAAPSPGPTGDTTATALSNAEQTATDWFEALSSGNVEALVSLSQEPFFIEATYAPDPDPLLMSKQAIRLRYEEILNGVSDEALAIVWRMTEIRPRTIAGLKDIGWQPDNDRFLGRVSLTDDDIVVAATSESGQEILLFFRRSGAEVALRGLSGLDDDQFIADEDEVLGDY